MTLLLLLCLIQEPPDSYEIRLTVEAENRHAIGRILKRYMSDMPGVGKMRFDTNRDTLVLQMALNSVLTREEIEEELPRIYNIARYKVVGLPGIVEKRGEKVFLKMLGSGREFILEPTDYTRNWFRDLDRLLEWTRGWIVAGRVRERRVGRGVERRIEMTISVEGVTNFKLPEKKPEPIETRDPGIITVRVLLEDLQEPESGDRIVAAAGRIAGVKGASYDADGRILTFELSRTQWIDVEALRAATRKEARAARILVDGVVGTIHEGGGGAVLRTPSNMEFRIEGKTDSARVELRVAERRKAKRRTWVVSGEVILVEERILIMARSIRPFRNR